MTCAKVEVHAYLVSLDGRVYHGSNWCAAPQAECPRAPGEGYEKCKSVCGQSAHAEVNAIAAAGDAARGATIVVDYHYVCDACKLECQMSDVKPMTVDEWLAQGNVPEVIPADAPIRSFPLKLLDAATFGNMPPKEYRATLPPPVVTPIRYRRRLSGE